MKKTKQTKQKIHLLKNSTNSERKLRRSLLRWLLRWFVVSFLPPSFSFCFVFVFCFVFFEIVWKEWFGPTEGRRVNRKTSLPLVGFQTPRMEGGRAGGVWLVGSVAVTTSQTFSLSLCLCLCVCGCGLVMNGPCFIFSLCWCRSLALLLLVVVAALSRRGALDLVLWGVSFGVPPLYFWYWRRYSTTHSCSRLWGHFRQPLFETVETAQWYRPLVWLWGGWRLSFFDLLLFGFCLLGRWRSIYLAGAIVSVFVSVLRCWHPSRWTFNRHRLLCLQWFLFLFGLISFVWRRQRPSLWNISFIYIISLSLYILRAKNPPRMRVSAR